MSPIFSTPRSRRRSAPWPFTAAASPLPGPNFYDRTFPSLMLPKKLLHSGILASFATLTSLAVDSPAPVASQAAPKTVEPPTSWIDPDTGHRVIRLTREPDSASLYFNDNGYTPDGGQMIYTTPEGISVLNLKTFETRAGRAGWRARHRSRAENAARLLHQAPPSGRSMPRTSTPARRASSPICRPRGGIAAINADETLAADLYRRRRPGLRAATSARPKPRPLDQPANKGQMMEERFAARAADGACSPSICAPAKASRAPAQHRLAQPPPVLAHRSERC